jgi:hypothetical protein
VKLNPLLFLTALLDGLIGLAFVFAPAEILSSIGIPVSVGSTWLAQVLGAALLSLAWLNWLQRYARIGGVLGRTVLLPNLMFTSVGFGLTLSAWRHEPEGTVILIPALLLGSLAVAFGLRLFGPNRAGN